MGWDGSGGRGAALAVQLLMASFLPYFFAAAFGLATAELMTVIPRASFLL